MSEKGNKLKKEAEQLLKTARASEWAMLKAEEYNEKLELSNATIAVLVSVFDNLEATVTNMGLIDRIKNNISIGNDHTKLLATYFRQMGQIDAEFRKKEGEYKKQLLESAKERGDIVEKS